ncbi:ABC transporter substrate-binding periplasmic protein [Neokomagataea thailandica NBRC 106555]|uniref:ABC transporter substrate-binding protein n=2 Tax=Neokomagataea TaxID=1223423 RepID=A0A4Y6V772_9PROT|nr:MULTISPECIES: zinc ABC transporter substrate-binding protein [Neokomagataea]QDH25224.1 ABC transporter substrate-binding protein [Neokomagataea tanensis]GBR54079.1 ABC transporter substrate-binding periplasmic protein [Neokomagataea thailandica NBRC 106555]
MTIFLRFGMLCAALAFGAMAHPVDAAESAPLHVVCVESVWCNVVAQIGKQHVDVQSIISTPGIDPHEFAPTPAMAKRLAEADFAVMNGAVYDDWAMPFVLHAKGHLNIGEKVGWKSGDDSHVFLNPQDVRIAVQNIEHILVQLEPAFEQDFNAGAAAFLADLNSIDDRLAALRAERAYTPYAATETQGSALFAQAGWTLLNARYARAIAQHMAPSPRDEAALETAIASRKITLLVLNPAVRAPQLAHLEDLARKASIPVIQVGETLPVGQSWQGWVSNILDQAEGARNAAQH